MATPFDATLKHLLEAYPNDWLRLVGVVPQGPVRLIGADLATVSAGADKALRIDAAVPWLLNLELQASYDATLADRLLLYNVLLTRRHGLPVRSIVILLRPKADGPTMTGRLRRALPNASTYLRFRYEILRLWQQPLESLRIAGPGTLPLAPLTAGAAGQLPEVARVMDRGINSGLELNAQLELWAAAAILMDLRYSPEAREQFEEKRKMITEADLEESSLYQQLIQRGAVRGHEEGIIAGAIRTLLRIGSDRFGEPDEATRQAIESLRDPQRIDRLISRFVSANSWAELLTDD